MSRRYLAPGLLLALAAVVAALMAAGILNPPRLKILIDAGSLAVVFLALAALLATGVALAYRYRDRAALRRKQAVELAVESTWHEAADDRRRFLQRLDHELKNPLTAIRAGVANLADAPGESGTESLSSVTAQTVRLSRLLADLRKLAELETRPLESSPVDIAELLREVTSQAEDLPDAPARRIALTLPQAPWPLPSVIGDRDLLFLAIHNLVDNALKFTAEGDTVEVRAFEDGSNVMIEVADTGPGVPEHELGHVWEELYRGEAARAVAGTGLGLALARAIVTRHGGATGLRSRVGQGSVFTVRLPTG